MHRISFKAVSVGVLLAATLAHAVAQSREPSPDPASARIVTSDLDNFWRAYDEGGKGSLEECLQRIYLDQGSPGVKAFLPGRIGSAAALAKTVTAGRAYYESTRTRMLQIRFLEKRIRAPFYALKYLYPEAVFPDVYFVVGRLSSGGTSQASGLIIGAEFYSGNPDSPTDLLSPWVRANLGDFDRIPAIVSHELIHYQQDTAEAKTLLARSLNEGAADFLGEMISGGNINRKAHEWSGSRQPELWAQFKSEMMGTDVSNWLYQGDKAKDRPADLGYYIGYKICEAYYNKASDKKKAIRDILTIKNFEDFLRESGYDPQPKF